MGLLTVNYVIGLNYVNYIQRIEDKLLYLF